MGGSRVARAERVARARFVTDVDDSIASGGRVIIEFTDYQCPFCRQMAPLVAALDERDVAVVRVHFPISAIHPRAETAARAVLCAEGSEAESALHERLMRADDWFEASDPWGLLAAQAGVSDTTAFIECLTGARVAERIARDRELARRLGVSATPTYVGLKGSHEGSATTEELLALTGTR